MRICWKCVNPCPPSSLAWVKPLRPYSMTALRIFANDFFGCFVLVALDLVREEVLLRELAGAG